MVKNTLLILLISISVSFAQVERDPLFDEVEIYLDQLKANSADIICPDDYMRALNCYNEAKEMSNEGESFRDAREELENCIYYVTEINEIIDSRQEIFSEVLVARKEALESNADKYAAAEWEEGEEYFYEAVEYAEDGEMIYARELFAKIKKYYNEASISAAEASQFINEWQPLKNANSELANLLSPNTYSEGKYYFNRALDNLSNNDVEEDKNENLNEAKIFFNKAAHNAANFSERYPGILSERSDAKSAGAENYAVKYWLDAEENLKSLGEMFENGEYESILYERPEAGDLYIFAKHEAVKNRILGPVKRKIEKAYDNDADDFAPLTLKQSEELYSEGIMLVESNSYLEEEIQKVADEAEAYAGLAIRITEIIKKSEAENPTWEEQILSWNTMPLKLNKQQPVLEAGNNYEPTAEKNVNVRSEYFDDVDDIFDNDEAIVKDMGGVIVISLIGLRLDPTQTKLNNSNKALVDKAIAAIELFPRAHITIVGHTDNASTQRYNKELSNEMAESVMNYIVKYSHVTPQRISYEGHGEEEPIADNKTYEGRMRNRRVDILIDYF